ncbi:MAG: Hsp70 family protein, partial [Candidatus Roseilinea sp.]|uniref:Hsp70 family protein n=1 Tax=Candidatus Roseilinea sp. TaxID=2838777 RepID=UPI00404B978E
AKDEIERMVRESQMHAEEDKARREKVEARNEADNAAYQAEKFIRENGDKIPADKKSELESRIAAVRSALTSDDVTAIRHASDELKSTFSQIGASMYQQAAQGASGPAGDGAAPSADGASKGPDDDVVEGEYRATK